MNFFSVLLCTKRTCSSGFSLFYLYFSLSENLEWLFLLFIFFSLLFLFTQKIFSSFSAFLLYSTFQFQFKYKKMMTIITHLCTMLAYYVDIGYLYHLLYNSHALKKSIN